MERYSPDALSKEVAYDIATEHLRRVVVRILLEDEQAWSVDSLATEATARMHDTAVADVADATHRRVAVALLHRDLPKLTDAGVIVFDFDRETVARGEHIDDIAPLV